MTKPTDDLEAVRVVAEALQGFDARDQERIIRWAREKLGLVALPALPTTSAKFPPTAALDLPAPTAATSPIKNPKTLESLLVEIPEVAEPQVGEPETEQSEAGEAEVEQPEVVEQPEIVNLLMPAQDQKNRVFILIGIILLAFATAFLIVMIASHAK